MRQYIITLLLLLAIFVTILFIVQESRPKKGWIPQSACERLVLSLVCATVIQLPIITTAPGWLVAAFIYGKDESMWIPMIVANFIIYTAMFYLYFLSRQSKES